MSRNSFSIAERKIEKRAAGSEFSRIIGRYFLLFTLAKETECGSEECIAYSKATWDAIEEYPNRLLTLHTHPNSMPPSVDDFNSCFTNGYVAGLVICHNGKIYQYTSRQYVEPRYFDLTVAGFLNMGYNEVEAQLAAISEVSKHFDIMFKEVTDNDGCARE